MLLTNGAERMETLQNIINFIASYPFWAKAVIAGSMAIIVGVLILGRTTSQPNDHDNPASSPSLKGHVYGFDSNPLPLASVSVTTGDTTRQISTDSNGFFSFPVGFAPPSGLLSISSPGYTTYRENLTPGFYKNSDFRVYLTAPHEANKETKKSAHEKDRIVAGAVVDEATGDSIQGAKISVLGRSENCTSESSGNFQLRVGSDAPSVVRLRVEKVGYSPYDVSATPPAHNFVVQLKRVK